MIFEVTPEQIERLSDEDLRTLVGFLAEQEAVRAGHSAACVTYGGHQNAKDGGIDVRVDLGEATIKGFIPRAKTGYQVKADDMPKKAIEGEMRHDGNLRPAIKKLGEDGGAYVIVSSKGSVADNALSQRKNAMSNALADEPTASALHVDFFDRRRIATWVNQHPGLVPWVRSRVGLPLSGWRPYDDWSSSPGAMTEQYFVDDCVRIVGVRLKESNGLNASAGIEKLREVLAQPKGAVRLVGLSGVGKTRLVQALFDGEIGSNALNPQLAVYADLADSPNPPPLELIDHLQHLNQRCVLIVDNCGAELHRKLCARMRSGAGALCVITIEYDISDDEPENTDTFKLEPASGEMIEKIVERRYPQLAQPEIRTIATFSEGNSRIALALADTAQHGGSLANLKDSGLIKRLFHQNHSEDPALLKAAKALALVYSFDGESLSGDDTELPRIAALAGQSIDELHGHIGTLIRRQLIQKRSKWRALLPHALAHRLAKEALQEFIPDRVEQCLVEGAPARFLKSFSRRIGCLHDSPVAQAIVARWLGQGGIVSNVAQLNELGVTILENVAPVNPQAVLDAIETAITQDPAVFRQHHHLDRIVSLLRLLAYEPQNFDRVLSLLVTLSTDAPESNNGGASVNVFKSLFYIYLSGTHAGVKQRADFLRKLATSEAANRASLIVSALDAMLECNHFTSSYSFEFGARKRDYGFQPESKAEVQGWYRDAFALAGDLAEHDYLQTEIRKMIANQLRYLAPGTGLTDELVALADRFAKSGGWREGWVGVRSTLADSKKHKRKIDTEKLEALEQRLSPNTLETRIASYVLPEQWGALDIAEIDFEDDHRYEKAQRKVAEVCAGIGKELAADLPLLVQNLPKMLASNSGRVSIVAETIGAECQEPRQAWNLILAEVLKPENGERIFGFPSAFLAGVSKLNKPLCDTLLDEALENSALHHFFVPMQASVGVDQAGCARLIKASKAETVPVHHFRILSGGRACDEVQPSDLKALLLAISQRDGGLDSALDIFQMRLFSKNADKRPIEPDEKDIGRALLGAVRFEKKRQREAHVLAEIVRACLTSSADEALAYQICERLLDGIAKFQIYSSDYGELVSELGAMFPRSVLDVLVECAPETLEGRRSIFSSFREYRPCPLGKMADDDLLEWAHERPETRFSHLAEVMRPWKKVDGKSERDFDDDVSPTQWTSAALRLLREAPEPTEVLNQYVEHFHPGGWSGSLTAILASRAPLLEILTKDTDQKIATAAAQALIKFKEAIERTREWEANMSRERDERFEW